MLGRLVAVLRRPIVRLRRVLGGERDHDRSCGQPGTSSRTSEGTGRGNNENSHADGHADDERDGSVWDLIPGWQYEGRHVESGGLTRDEQERAIADIRREAEAIEGEELPRED